MQQGDVIRLDSKVQQQGDVVRCNNKQGEATK
jgi:hypothetical protein